MTHTYIHTHTNVEIYFVHDAEGVLYNSTSIEPKERRRRRTWRVCVCVCVCLSPRVARTQVYVIYVCVSVSLGDNERVAAAVVVVGGEAHLVPYALSAMPYSALPCPAVV